MHHAAVMGTAAHVPHRLASHEVCMLVVLSDVYLTSRDVILSAYMCNADMARCTSARLEAEIEHARSVVPEEEQDSDDDAFLQSMDWRADHAQPSMDDVLFSKTIMSIILHACANSLCFCVIVSFLSCCLSFCVCLSVSLHVSDVLHIRVQARRMPTPASITAPRLTLGSVSDSNPSFSN